MRNYLLDLLVTFSYIWPRYRMSDHDRRFITTKEILHHKRSGIEHWIGVRVLGFIYLTVLFTLYEEVLLRLTLLRLGACDTRSL